MSKQPEALRLADEIEANLLAVANRKIKPADWPLEPIAKSYAELRRLHEVNQELLEVLASIAALAVGEGDVCENIAKRACTAIKATEKNT